MKSTIAALLLTPAIAFTQAPVNKWLMNNNGQKASYWQNSGGPQNPSFSYTLTNDSADILRLCYSPDTTWIRCDGMTFNMGKYLNPGGVSPQNYTFKFPRNPSVATIKAISPMEGPIGLLLNGVPIYGLSNANSWSSTTNSNVPGPQGQHIWNVEVYKSEGFVLDTALGAHPQQQGAYHSHATPYRLYKYATAGQHSPLVGFAFDGYPVYGPYGYSTATLSTSQVTRMKSGYSLRNITNRQTLPDGTTLNSNQYGPAVSGTYPLGTYCEDYEWLSANGGDLDQYNGRFCVTPEYPSGTYAYFVTVDANGIPAFPYYIGFKYNGNVANANFMQGMSGNTVVFPVSGTNCNLATNLETYRATMYEFSLYPNPSNGMVSISTKDFFDQLAYISVIGLDGKVIINKPFENGNADLDLTQNASGLYIVKVYGNDGRVYGVEKVVKE